MVAGSGAHRYSPMVTSGPQFTKANFIPPDFLAHQPDAYYYILREHVIDRIYDQTCVLAGDFSVWLT
ncbi:MAG TPA: hypothetical protein VJS37_06970 [Terriglobales bacterium]|nr:hypothetical protein [Terriglobales bacterium]